MSLARRAFTVSAWTFVSRMLGLVRDRLWAGALGGSPLLDAFLTAFALPNMLRELFGDGALSAAFLPRYVQLRDKDPVAAERFAGAFLTRTGIFLAAIALALMVAAAVVGWCAWPETKAWRVAWLALPMIPYLVFICLVALMGAVANARKLFWVPAAMPVVLNCCLISTLWFGPEHEARILPWAVLVAGVIQFGCMLLALRWRGGVPPPALIATPEEAELRRAVAPVLLSSSAFQLNSLIGQGIAYFLIPGSGAVAFLYFANRLLQFPLALVGHAVTTASGPELAARALEGYRATGTFLAGAIRLQAFWLMPASIGLIVMAEPLVRAVYQTGKFDEDSVARTVLATRMYAAALVPVALNRQLVRAFHAHRDQRTPMLVTLLAVGLNLVVGVILVLTPLREAGLALATGVSALIGSILYAVILARRGTGAVIDPRALVRPALAAAVMAGAVAWLLHTWPQPQGEHVFVPALTRLLAAMALGATAYLALAGTGWLRRRRPDPAKPVEPVE